MMTLEEAIEWVEQGKADRIAVPGKWKVWRAKGEDGADQVKHEVIAK
jgi:hypothetical protein|nr:MAG TPA: hypothetical protein [Caudoviricetes sp.]